MSNLQSLLSEYGDSLARVDGEKDHQDAIAKRAEIQCHCLQKNFKKLALAIHKGKLALTRNELNEQLGLFNQAIGDEE